MYAGRRADVRSIRKRSVVVFRSLGDSLTPYRHSSMRAGPREYQGIIRGNAWKGRESHLRRFGTLCDTNGLQWHRSELGKRSYVRNVVKTGQEGRQLV